MVGLTAALPEPVFSRERPGPPADHATLAAAAEAARLAGRAIAGRPELAGRILGRRPAQLANRRVGAIGAGLVNVERAIDGIALAGALARSLGIDPLVAAEATALRDLALVPAAGPPAGAATGPFVASSAHWRHPLLAADRVLAAGGSMAAAAAGAPPHHPP